MHIIIGRHDRKKLPMVNQNLIANAIFHHLHPSDKVLFNKVLVSSEKVFRGILMATNWKSLTN
jgi:hypothetical protein